MKKTNDFLKNAEACRPEAVKQLIRFAKDFTSHPGQDLQRAVNAYLEACLANNGRTREDCIELREIALSGLIIDCIYKCSSAELSKLDGIKPVLAANF